MKKRGIVPGRDIYVFGYDNASFTSQMTPTLTSLPSGRTLHSAFDMFNRTSEKAYNITVSTGFYLLPGDTESTLQETLAHADAMLYEEKQKRDKNIAKILQK